MDIANTGVTNPHSGTNQMVEVTTKTVDCFLDTSENTTQYFEQDSLQRLTILLPDVVLVLASVSLVGSVLVTSLGKYTRVPVLEPCEANVA